MWFDDTGPFLGAAKREVPRQTAYLILAEMTEPSINPQRGAASVMIGCVEAKRA
jgi:hypothetical protein